MTTRTKSRLKDSKDQMKMMHDWNRDKIDLRDQFLPKNIGKMENAKTFKTFMEVYGAMPFKIDEEQAGKLHLELTEGYIKGGKKKYGKEEGILILGNASYQGYNMYPYHKGSEKADEAQKNQKAATTTIKGRELNDIRYSLDAFNYVMFGVENLTGLSVVKLDILRQSETGFKGKREAIFSYHIDTDEVPTATATATILLTNTTSSMQMLGYQPVPYNGVGSGCLFASGLFHQTVCASEGTMKITLFLERRRDDPLEYFFTKKDTQDTDVKWNLSEEYLRYVQGTEGKGDSINQILTAFRKRGKASLDRLHGLRGKGEDLISDEYLRKCWKQVTENEVLKTQFITWYEMTAPLVFYVTEGEKGKGGMNLNKGSGEDMISEEGEEDDEDTDVDSQDEETRHICKRKHKTKEGARSNAYRATLRCKKRRESLDTYGSGNLKEEGWQIDSEIYLDKKENHAINDWLNEEGITGEMEKSLFSSKDMREFYKGTTIFGSKMIQTISRMKMKFTLTEQELFEIVYFLALPDAENYVYKLRNKRCEYIFLFTFTELDVKLRLERGNHYFRVPAKRGLIFESKLDLTIVENKTQIRHRFTVVEFARKCKLNEV